MGLVDLGIERASAVSSQPYSSSINAYLWTFGVVLRETNQLSINIEIQHCRDVRLWDVGIY